MNPSDAFQEVLTLFEHSGWCQGAGARDVHGRNIPVDPRRDPPPVQFSLDGALQRVTWPDLAPDPEEPQLWQTLVECMERLARLAGMNGDMSAWGYLIDWNDVRGRTKEQVVELVTEALTDGKE